MAVPDNKPRWDYEFRDYRVPVIERPPPSPPIVDLSGTLLTEGGLALLTESDQPLII